MRLNLVSEPISNLSTAEHVTPAGKKGNEILYLVIQVFQTFKRMNPLDVTRGAIAGSRGGEAGAASL
jgi:hypothetical protein